MIWLFLFPAIVMIGLVVFIVEILIPRAIIALGKMDSSWSPFRILPPPGEMYIIVRGSPDGPFDNVIESVEGYGYDNNTHLFKKTKRNEESEEGYLRQIGVTWVGFWHYFLWRKVRYDKWEKRPDPSTDWGLVSKVRGDKKDPDDSPSIFFRYNMATKIEAAETFGNFPVDGIVVFTVQIHNPVQAFFFAGGWEAQTNAAVQGVFREYVSKKTIEQLRQEQAVGADTLVADIKKLSGGVAKNGGLRALFGIEIVDARFVKFDLVGGDAAMTKAVRALEIETLNAEANAKKGEGERRQRQERATGVRAEVEAWGAHAVGGTVAMAEAIKEAKPNVLGGNIISSVEGVRKE